MSSRAPLIAVAAMALVAACSRSEAPRRSAPPMPGTPAAESPPAAPDKAAPGTNPSRVSVLVTEKGFEPATIPAQAGKPVTLAITRKTERTCATEIVFKNADGKLTEKTPLPLDKEVEVTYTPQAPGQVQFGCAMGLMIAGVLTVAP